MRAQRAFRRPVAPVRELRREVLAEEACHVLALRGKRGIERAWDQHLDHRLARPAFRARVRVGFLHVGERRRHDDAGAVVGAFIMGVMNNGMSIMGIPVDLQQAIKGLVILFAVAFDMYAKSKQSS